MATRTLTFTGAVNTGNRHWTARITLNGRNRDIGGDGDMAANDSTLQDPVVAAVAEAVLGGTTSGTITVTAA